MNSFFDKFFRWLRYRKVLKYIPKNSIVCDIGCGQNAHFLKSISGIVKRGIGFDERVENYKDSKYEFKKLKVSKDIPLEEKSCDMVTMTAVLEHLSDPQAILDESWRILKKNGKMILTTPTPSAKPVLEFLAFKLQLIDKNEIRDHKNYFRPAEIKKMLLKSGFEDKNIEIHFFELNLNSLTIAQK